MQNVNPHCLLHMSCCSLSGVNTCETRDTKHSRMCGWQRQDTRAYLVWQRADTHAHIHARTRTRTCTHTPSMCTAAVLVPAVCEPDEARPRAGGLRVAVPPHRRRRFGQPSPQPRLLAAPEVLGRAVPSR